MKFGLYGINTGPCSDPDVASRVAKAAEAAGFDSVWTAEHVVLPDPQAPPSPAPPQMKLLDPAVALSFLAAHTTRLLLATGIIILPQRNPVVLAKELASVDRLSKGRLVFGLGAGYLKPEFQALGVPFGDRGKRTDEYIEAIVALWTQDEPEYKGEYVAFGAIQAHPHPVQKPHPPIFVGGMSPSGLRRAARYGNGWYGFALDLDATRHALEGLRAAEQRFDRSAALGRLEITVTPAGAVDADVARAYQALGVDRLVLLNPGRNADDQLRFVEKAGRELVAALA
ncbi:MAG: LLM class F420-dependent oxidoreductase [Deltaproteobacteria bacterium]|nr:LLM class F420-dependent oxidoreductase [Deltaproteobacteria bacterium]